MDMYPLMKEQPVTWPDPLNTSLRLTYTPTRTHNGSEIPALIEYVCPPMVIDPLLEAVAWEYALTSPLTVTRTHSTVQPEIRPFRSRWSRRRTSDPTLMQSHSGMPVRMAYLTPAIVIEPFDVAVALVKALTRP